MKGNCQNCKYGITDWSDNKSKFIKDGFSLASSKYSDEDLMVKCANGFNKENLNWWIENKNKKSSETTNMICYKPNDIEKSLNNMCGNLDKMIEIIDNYNKNK